MFMDYVNTISPDSRWKPPNMQHAALHSSGYYYKAYVETIIKLVFENDFVAM